MRTATRNKEIFNLFGLNPCRMHKYKDFQQAHEDTLQSIEEYERNNNKHVGTDIRDTLQWVRKLMKRHSIRTKYTLEGEDGLESATKRNKYWKNISKTVAQIQEIRRASINTCKTVAIYKPKILQSSQNSNQQKTSSNKEDKGPKGPNGTKKEHKDDNINSSTFKKEIKTITGHKTRRAQLKFTVIWKDFEDLGALWEHETIIFQNHPGQLKEYLKELQAKNKKSFTALANRYPHLITTLKN